jgi:hypothetical protein
MKTRDSPLPKRWREPEPDDGLPPYTHEQRRRMDEAFVAAMPGAGYRRTS